MEEYRDLGKEIKALDREIEKCKREITRDSVKMSDRHFPYTMHRQIIEGINSTRLKKLEMQKRIAELKRLEIEDIIMGIEDSKMRQIVRMRCMDGLSWQAIGYRTGYDPSWVRKKFVDFEKSQKSQK